MKERIALSAFPASAIVIIVVWVLQAASAIDVPDFVSAAATGLLTYGAYVTLGAGTKAEKKPQ